MRGFLPVLQVDPDRCHDPPSNARRPRIERPVVSGPLAKSLSMASIAANMAGDRASARRLRDEAQARGSGPR